MSEDNTQDTVAWGILILLSLVAVFVFCFALQALFVVPRQLYELLTQEKVDLGNEMNGLEAKLKDETAALEANLKEQFESFSERLKKEFEDQRNTDLLVVGDKVTSFQDRVTALMSHMRITDVIDDFGFGLRTADTLLDDLFLLGNRLRKVELSPENFVKDLPKHTQSSDKLWRGINREDTLVFSELRPILVNKISKNKALLRSVEDLAEPVRACFTKLVLDTETIQANLETYLGLLRVDRSKFRLASGMGEEKFLSNYIGSNPPQNHLSEIKGRQIKRRQSLEQKRRTKLAA